jgi:hypothetical protein
MNQMEIARQQMYTAEHLFENVLKQAQQDPNGEYHVVVGRQGKPPREYSDAMKLVKAGKLQHIRSERNISATHHVFRIPKLLRQAFTTLPYHADSTYPIAKSFISSLTSTPEEWPTLIFEYQSILHSSFMPASP